MLRGEIGNCDVWELLCNDVSQNGNKKSQPDVMGGGVVVGASSGSQTDLHVMQLLQH